jgi:hypothetical protein
MIDLSDNAMYDSDTFIRHLLTNKPDSIFILKNDIITECNIYAIALFGGNQKELCGKSLIDISPEYQPDGTRSSDKISSHTVNVSQGSHSIFEWTF